MLVARRSRLIGARTPVVATPSGGMNKVPLTRHQQDLGGGSLRSYALNLEADEQDRAMSAGEPVGGSDTPRLDPARQR